jgi:AraC family transcriptional regulator, regulatory protein of adaptative response / methylated-DNA-[protein]-cysteine methyltransferase
MNQTVAETNQPSFKQHWAAVLARDGASDGRFVYAVTTTGIFCRPSCRSRKPNPRNVRFFPDPAAAAAAGFRACKRCDPASAKPGGRVAAIVGRACAAIDSRLARVGDARSDARAPLSVRDMADSAGLSVSYFQRLFVRATGISPKAFIDQRRLALLKRELRAGEGVAAAVYGAGFGSPSRVYERAHGQLGMTPGAYAKHGKNMTLDFAIADCRLGKLLVAATALGVAAVYLGDGGDELIAELRREFSAAAIRRDDAALTEWVRAIARHLDGRSPTLDLPTDVRASVFERRVWQELRRIPLGETRTYGEVARAIGKPGAARAVGRACALNPVSIVVPCHRVVRGDGQPGGYRWGIARKHALLAAEREQAKGGAK